MDDKDLFDELTRELWDYDDETKLQILEKYRIVFAERALYIDANDEEYKKKILIQLKKLIENNGEQQFDLAQSAEYVSVLDYANYMLTFLKNWDEKKRTFDSKLYIFDRNYPDFMTDSMYVEKYDLYTKCLYINMEYMGEHRLVLTKHYGKLTLVDANLTDHLAPTVRYQDVLAKYYNILSYIYDYYALYENIINRANGITYQVTPSLAVEINATFDSFHIKLIDSETSRIIAGIDYLNEKCVVYDDGSKFASALSGREEDMLDKMHLRIDDLPIHFRNDLIRLKKEKLEFVAENKRGIL